jgi:hypothetical protein
MFKLPIGLFFFLVFVVGGEEAAEGPNVNDRDSDDASAVPTPEPSLDGP